MLGVTLVSVFVVTFVCVGSDIGDTVGVVLHSCHLRASHPSGKMLHIYMCVCVCVCVCEAHTYMYVHICICAQFYWMSDYYMVDCLLIKLCLFSPATIYVYILMS